MKLQPPECKHITLRLLIFVVLLYQGETYDKRYACYEHFGNDALVIEPRNTIYQKINESITVYCSSNPIYNTSSRELYFSRGLSRDANKPHEILNENTIFLNILEKTASKNQLSCQDSKNNKCLRDIIFGYPPLNVENFRCISFNWRYLECAYNTLQNPAHRAQDDYFLSYSLRGKSIFGFKCKSGHEPCCSIEGKECWRWDNSEDFLYDVTQQYLNFTVSSTNPLGTRSYSYEVNQYEIMIPDPVRELNIKLKDDSQISLSGRLPTFLNLFPPGIVYRIKTQVCKHQEEILGKIQGRKLFTTSINAPWPGLEYQISVSLRSGNNSWVGDTEIDEWWSQSVSRTIMTPSQPPRYAPRTTAGGFQVLNWESSSTTVILYWKDLDDCWKGGKDFKYHADVDVKNESPLTEITDTYAIYENFIIEKDKDYTFSLTPVNEAGRGQASTVVIRRRYLPEGVFFPVVIYHPEDDVLQFRWFTTETNVDFILFWCPVEDNFNSLSKVLCKSIRWKHISNETKTNLTKSELDLKEEVALQNLRFGVSTQKWSGGVISSSGIVWSSCLLGSYDPEGSKMVPSAVVLIRTESSILVVWELECEMWRSFPLSIQVFWCEGEHNSTSQCTVGLKIQDISSSSLEIDDLRMNQNYTLWIRVGYRTWESDYSSPVRFATTTQTLSPGSIVFICAVTVVAMVTILFLVIYSPKKLMVVWRTAKQKLNLPLGIEPGGEHFGEKNLSPLSNDKLSNYVNREKIRPVTAEFPSMQPLLSEEYASKTPAALEGQCAKFENSEVETKHKIDENKSTIHSNDSDNLKSFQQCRNLSLKDIESADFSHISIESKVSVSKLPSTGYVAAFTPASFQPSYRELDKRNGYIIFNDQTSTVLNGSDKKISYSISPLENTSNSSLYVQAFSPISYDKDLIRIKNTQKEKYLTIHSFDNLNIVFNNDANKNMSKFYCSSANLSSNEKVKGRSYSSTPTNASLSPLSAGYVQAIIPVCNQMSNEWNLAMKNKCKHEESQSVSVLYDNDASYNKKEFTSIFHNNSNITSFYSNMNDSSTSVDDSLSQNLFIGPTHETFMTADVAPLEYVKHSTNCDDGKFLQKTDFRVSFLKEGTTFGKVTVRNKNTKEITELQEIDKLQTLHTCWEEAKSLPNGFEDEEQLNNLDNKQFTSHFQRTNGYIRKDSLIYDS